MKRRDMLTAMAMLPATWSAPLWAQALPPPPHGQAGRLRLAGTPAMANVVTAWAKAFAKDHPHIAITTAMRGSDVAMAGLYTATCDLAFIGREATKPEVQAFEWVYRFRPKGVSVLRGSVDRVGCSPALAVFVHPSNPIASLTMDDLKAAFGDQGRRARCWGDLGLSGPWADRPIHLYAPEAESGTGRYFRSTVLDGSNRMAWDNMHEYAVPPRPERAEAKAAADMRRAIGRNPHAMGVGVMGAGVRAVPVGPDAGSAILPTPLTVADGLYPLSRTMMAYYAAPPAGAVHDATRAFLQFLLTPAAQAIAANSSAYLPLSADALGQARGMVG